MKKNQIPPFETVVSAVKTYSERYITKTNLKKIISRNKNGFILPSNYDFSLLVCFYVL